MDQAITPYLTQKNAAAAIDFYKKAFKAEERMRMPAEDGKRLMHAELAINGGTVMMSDEFPEHGGPPAPSTERQAGVAVAIAFGQPSEVDTTFKRAVAEGAQAIMEPADQFWGARFAMLTDPFGHRWMLNAPLPQKG